jgi:uncharacterized protein (UPF0276 family)
VSRTAGLGFKPQHLADALACRADGLWFEVHPENYMVDGGPRLAALSALRERHPISLHGVGLSVAAVGPPEPDHLARLKALVDRFKPVAVSDHLGWQRWRGRRFMDFLPFPRTREALEVVAGNVERVQGALQRPLLLENPATYAELPGHEMDEAEFFDALVLRTGCGLLLDVNNVFVSAHNLDEDPATRLAAYPMDAVAEIHLAGHRRDSSSDGRLLIDSHDAPVSQAVWRLYADLVARIGCVPTLIERDDDIPPFAALLAERAHAHAVLRGRADETTPGPRHVFA